MSHLPHLPAKTGWNTERLAASCPLGSPNKPIDSDRVTRYAVSQARHRWRSLEEMREGQER